MCVLLLWIVFGIALLLLVATVLWKTNAYAKLFLKFSWFAVVSMVSATLPIPLMLLRPRDYRNALIPAAGCRASCKLMGIKTAVKGKENIVKNSGCVVLINHQSVLDLIVLAELWPVMDRCAVISKKEIFYIWPFGLASWLWGTIFIDRLNAEKAQDSINKTGQIIKDRKARVLMFPEGTRNNKGKLLPFKKGAFHLAVASGCPIQPVVVSQYTFLGDRRFDEGNMEINILPPISTENLTKDDIPELIERTHKTMSEYFEKLYTQKNGVKKTN